MIVLVVVALLQVHKCHHKNAWILVLHKCCISTEMCQTICHCYMVVISEVTTYQQYISCDFSIKHIQGSHKLGKIKFPDFSQTFPDNFKVFPGISWSFLQPVFKDDF